MDIFCIGDIHGVLDKFNKLWKLAKPSKDNLIIFLGDLVDRGPNSSGVVQRVLDLKKSGFNIVSLMGNHEDMFIRFLNEREKKNDESDEYYSAQDVFFYNGGRATTRSYKYNFPKSHIDFIKNMSLFFETDEFIFVHAGVKPGIPMKNQEKDNLLWIRNEFFENGHKLGKTVVFGHTPTFIINGSDEPFITEDKIGLDTGCVFGGKLTGMQFPSKEYVAV